jgi:translation initiation factor 4A
MDITCQAFIGGTGVGENIQQLRSGIQVVVGTPGRVFHMLERSALRTSLTLIGCLFSTMMYLSETKYIKMLIVDEADEMLREGFKEQIYNIFQLMPQDVQV